MTDVICRLTAKNWVQIRNPTLGNRVWATFTFLVIQYFGEAVLRPSLLRPGATAPFLPPCYAIGRIS